MGKTRYALALAGCLFAWTNLASAQDTATGEAATSEATRGPEPFDAASTWVVGLELAEVAYRREPDWENDLGAGRKSVGETSTTTLVANRPNLGVDYFVARHLSLGLGAIYDYGRSHSESHEEGPGAANGGTTSNASSHSVFLFPRVGVAYTWPSGLGVWARADALLRQTWSTNDNPVGKWRSFHDGSLAARVEALGTYSPANHVVLTAGPSLAKVVARFHDDHDTSGTTASDYPVSFAFAVGAGVYF